jgi:hypothetical protein
VYLLDKWGSADLLERHPGCPSEVDPDGLEAASASAPFPLVPKLELGNKKQKICTQMGELIFPVRSRNPEGLPLISAVPKRPREKAFGVGCVTSKDHGRLTRLSSVIEVRIDIRPDEPERWREWQA